PDLPLVHLKEIGYDVTVVVLDGHSTDSTVGVARSFGATVVPQQGKGKGTAMREGLAWAQAHGMEYMAVLDADYTYPGSGIPPLLALLDAGSDLVVGVRRPEDAPTGSARDMVHRVGNGLLNYLAAQMSRSPILDVCSGLWGVRTKSFETIPLVSEGFEIEAELFLKAFRYGLHVSQMPIAYRKRVGTAKLQAARDGARICLTIFRHAWTRPGSEATVDIVSPQPTESRPFPDLQRIVLATDARELVVYSHPGRAREAEALAESLRAAQLGVEVVIHPYGSLAQETWGLNRAAMDAVSTRGGPVPILVNLPNQSPDDSPVAVVGLPRTRRVVYLGGPGAIGDSTPPPFDQSGGYRLERPARRKIGSMTLLTAVLDPSPRIRELALLAANGRDSGVNVYQYVTTGPHGDGPTAGRRGPPPGASPQ
ncbi:MAG: glycosyltransferase family 2 protein, partial [Thermoplasmata archaeon]|nr:glycosyltransferase family 2 protein [Thermoplasmata archaeon]